MRFFQDELVKLVNPRTPLGGLVDGALREIVGLRLERESSKSLFVLGDVLAEHVQEGLGLLGAQVDCLMVFDGDLVGTLAGSQSEDELEIPHADANLNAVGVGLAVIGRLGEIELRLRVWTHDFIRLLCRGEGAQCSLANRVQWRTEGLVRKRGLEPLSLSALAPKAIFARFTVYRRGISSFISNAASILLFRCFS
jgi:hypothetical protein